LLYHNAGFTSLRKKKELDKIEKRFDPAVIPLPKTENEAPISYTKLDVGELRVPAKDAKGRFYTIADFHEAYKTGALTPTEVVEHLLPLIRRDVANRSPHSTAFMDSRVDDIRKAAEESTQRWKDGKPLGVLDGVPFAVKDEIDIHGYKRYNGTKKDYTNGEPVGTSWCVKKLEEDGAVMVGKTSMHELGMDTTNNNPNWGTPLNPYNEQYYTGGSSGGSAYAVAAGLVPFAVGADGGGSIRIPSNYCGIYGLKTSQGRVSVSPLTSPSSTVTVQGPMAANMADLAVSFRVCAQPDPSNPISRQFAPPRPLSGPRKKILGIPKVWFDRADPVVQETCYAALRYFTTELGYELVDVTIPLLHESQLAHAVTILAEAATAEPSLDGLTPPNRILMKVAQQIPATDWLLAQRLRNLLMQHLAYLFTKHPGLIIVTPTTPNVGWPISPGEKAYGMSDGNMQIRNMEYVWLANFTGIPALQFPAGFVEPKQGKGKVPVGMTGNGEWGSEDALIEFGYDAEAWLNTSSEEGRRRPEGWVDVLGMAKK
jgi:Asp-tRNA(Asn)/Glu-tRNA(Gln) amidotransferase A subunit family amidase